MRLETEDVALVQADPLEDPVAIKQPVIEHGDFRVGFVHKLSVQVDLHTRLRH